MEGYFRGNVERIKKGSGSLQAHSKCEACEVLALEEFCLVGVRHLQASAPAAADRHYEAVELFKWELPVECYPLATEFCPGSARRGLNCAGGRFTLENSSSDALILTSSIKAKMAPRQRLFSRRGSARGGSSRNPVAESHHHCCCRYCHRRSGAMPLQVSQFMDSGSPSAGPPPLPAFGTVVFTLGCSRNNARINAHISVLFIEDSQEGEGGSGREEAPSEDQSDTMEAEPAEVPE